MKKCAVGSYKNCVEMSMDGFRLAIATQFGPRIMGCYIEDDDNMFAVLPNRAMKAVGNGYKLYGGHRLWHAPEAKPRSYQPDNEAVDIQENDGDVEFSAMAPEVATGILKRVRIETSPHGLFTVCHTLENHGMWDVEVAPWALSMMAPGGMAVIPQLRNPAMDPYTPDRTLALWPYTNCADPRLLCGEHYYFLKQDSEIAAPIKIGASMKAEYGWVAYVRNGKALIKYFEINVMGEYPDCGCVVESCSNKDYCEIETLAPLEMLEPGESVEHIEYWQGISNLPKINNEADFIEHVVPQLMNFIAKDADDFDYSCCDDVDCDCDEDSACRHR